MAVNFAGNRVASSAPDFGRRPLQELFGFAIVRLRFGAAVKYQRNQVVDLATANSGNWGEAKKELTRNRNCFIIFFLCC